MDKVMMHRLQRKSWNATCKRLNELWTRVRSSRRVVSSRRMLNLHELAMTCCRPCCRVTKSSCRWDWTAPPQLQENEMTKLTKQNREPLDCPARLKRLKAEQRDMVPGPWLLQAYPLKCTPRLILFPEGVKTKPVATEMWAKFGGWWGLMGVDTCHTVPLNGTKEKMSRFN